MALRELVTFQFIEVSQKYPDLALFFKDEGAMIFGTIAFRRKVADKWISDVYEISIEIPARYPDEMPETKETGGRVPASFHTNPGNYLCLEVPNNIQLRFRENPTLLFYIDNFVIDYLTTYTVFRRTGKTPFGERAHGLEGKLQYYEELFQTKDWCVILDYMQMIINQKYRGHRPCFCGSGKKLRDCHREDLIKMMNVDKLELFQSDYYEINTYFLKNGEA